MPPRSRWGLEHSRENSRKLASEPSRGHSSFQMAALGALQPRNGYSLNRVPPSFRKHEQTAFCRLWCYRCVAWHWQRSNLLLTPPLDPTSARGGSLADRARAQKFATDTSFAAARRSRLRAALPRDFKNYFQTSGVQFDHLSIFHLSFATFPKPKLPSLLQ